MNKARHSLPNVIAAHAILITYTLIALFPVFVIVVNSFKTRKHIFREPLALPNKDSFSMVGYETVFNQGDFFLYFQNSMIVTVVSLCRCVVVLYSVVRRNGRVCVGGVPV